MYNATNVSFSHTKNITDIRFQSLEAHLKKFEIFLMFTLAEAIEFHKPLFSKISHMGMNIAAIISHVWSSRLRF